MTWKTAPKVRELSSNPDRRNEASADPRRLPPPPDPLALFSLTDERWTSPDAREDLNFLGLVTSLPERSQGARGELWPLDRVD
jgi:hypothetical protein